MGKEKTFISVTNRQIYQEIQDIKESQNTIKELLESYNNGNNAEHIKIKASISKAFVIIGGSISIATILLVFILSQIFR